MERACWKCKYLFEAERYGYATQANENVIENVIEISEEKMKQLMPEYSKKKLAKACEILKMISENPVGTTTQTKKKQRPN